jgi:hypothetical protein
LKVTNVFERIKELKRNVKIILWTVDDKTDDGERKTIWDYQGHILIA